MDYHIKEEGGFKYIEQGQGEVVILLHGLFGALSNWQSVFDNFSDRFRVIIPILPIYSMPLKKASVEGLVKVVKEFVEFMKLDNFSLVGNSLGGHVGIIYTLEHQDKINKLILTGSSGLFENSMGGSFPKRGNYEYIKDRVEYTFYDPKTISKEYIDEIFEVANNIQKVLRIIAIAKSAQRHNLANDLPKIKTPVLLIWGLNDTITPPLVAHDFNRLLPNSQLRFIDKCCHAPMMEHPDIFNEILEEFLIGEKIEV